MIIAAKLEERREWNLQAMKLVQETRRLESCLEWLGTLGDDPETVAIPELKHEPAIDLVADRLDRRWRLRSSLLHGLRGGISGRNW